MLVYVGVGEEAAGGLNGVHLSQDKRCGKGFADKAQQVRVPESGMSLEARTTSSC